MEMVQPSVWTTVVFVAIVASIGVALVWGAWRASPPDEPEEERSRWVWMTAMGTVVWLVATGLASGSGVLEGGGEMPPRLMIFFGASNLLAIGLAFSPLGTRLITGLPVWLLVAFHAFRLPLELVLHAWWEEGVLPVQMTYSGHNFDIVTGVLALVVGRLLYRLGPSRLPVLVFNVIGIGLLITVATIAVTSSPLPLRTYMNDPPVLLGYHFPYGWIVPFCVSGALFGHLLVFRWLWRARAVDSLPA